MLGRLPIRRVVRVGRDRLLRLRDGLLVRGPARDDLVPGPHPRGRAAAARRRRRARARTGTPRSTRTTCRSPTTPTSSRSAGAALSGSSDAPAGSLGSASTGASSSPASCSGWPARRGSRSCSGRRSSCSSAAAARGAVAAVGRRSARRSRSGRCSLYNLVTTGQLFQPGYDYLYRARGERLPDARLPPRLGDRGPPLPARRTSGSCCSARRRSCRTSVPPRLGDGQALCTDPGAVRGLFDPDCPLAVPRDTGMSVLLTSPAYLLAIPPVLAAATGRSRLVTGAALAVLVDRVRQPHALQPGLGPVRLPLQQRLRAVRARPRRARAWSGSGCGSGRRSPVS